MYPSKSHLSLANLSHFLNITRGYKEKSLEKSCNMIIQATNNSFYLYKYIFTQISNKYCILSTEIS